MRREDERTVRFNSDEELRALQQAVAGGDVLSARRLVRAYERAGLIPREREAKTVWVVTHYRHRGGRSWPEAGYVIDGVIVGVYPTEDRAYQAAAQRAIAGRWKLRNREATREFDRAVAQDDLRQIVSEYSAGSKYSIDVTKKVVGMTLPEKASWDGESWSL